MKKLSVNLVIFTFLIFCSSCRSKPGIDLSDLVIKSEIQNSIPDKFIPLSIGNGRFSYTVDITGMQTFPELCSGSIIHDSVFSHGENKPHNIILGFIGLQIIKNNGSGISQGDIEKPLQKLNLYTGEIESKFLIGGVPVRVLTVCHSNYDLISVKIISQLVMTGGLKIKIGFLASDSSRAGTEKVIGENSITELMTNNLNLIESKAGEKSRYLLLWRNGARFKEVTKNRYLLEPLNADSVYSFSCQFLDDPAFGRVQNFGETEAASKRSWEKFWTSLLTDKHFRKERIYPESDERENIISAYFARINCQNPFHL
jgi:protein-glucosylgalactosylhydroxylysine glucosidase